MSVEVDAQKYVSEAMLSLALFLPAAGETEKKEIIKIALEQAFRSGYVRGFGDATRRETPPIENPTT